MDFGKHPFLEMIGKFERDRALILERIKARRRAPAALPWLEAAEEKRRRKAERAMQNG